VQQEAGEEEETPVQEEVDEDEDEDEDGGGTGATASSSSSGVYLRGPSTLPDRPHTRLRPVIRLEGQR